MTETTPSDCPPDMRTLADDMPDVLPTGRPPDSHGPPAHPAPAASL